MKRITIKDIAKMLNISTSTVSRALKDHPDISLLVRQKVKETAEAFNYVPDQFAINFRKKSSKIIGLIVPRISMFFVPSIIKGISEKLTSENYKFFILSSEESLEHEIENLKICYNSHVDGILISLTSESRSLDHLKESNTMDIPLVIFDKNLHENSDYPYIIFDHAKYAQMCAQKFIESGSKNILAIYGSENLEMTLQRKKAFEETLDNHSKIAYSSIFCSSPQMVTDKLTSEVDLNKFDGIFAMSDEILGGLSCHLKEKKVDENAFKIVAISEGSLPKYMNPNYEYVINNGYKMGIEATELLLAKIQKLSTVNGSMQYLI